MKKDHTSLAAVGLVTQDSSPLLANGELEQYLFPIEKALKNLNPQLSLFLDFSLKNYHSPKINEEWFFEEICYMVANVSDSMDEMGLKLRAPHFVKSKVRSNLSRNLRRGRDTGVPL